MKEQRLVYPVPQDAHVDVRRDLTYRVVDGVELRLDVYRPAETARPPPVALFVHGDGPPDVLRDIKDWGQYVSWGELTAASGIAAVTFNHRSSDRRRRMPEVAGDVEAALDYVRDNARGWGVDADRLGVWTCSMGVPFATRLAFDRREHVRCIAALYGPLDLSDDPSAPESVTLEERLEFSALHHLGRGRALPPLLVARAGKDHPLLNDSIDRFVGAALERNLELDVYTHPSGQHGFDLLDDCARSRAIVRATLEFFRSHLVAA